MKVLIMGGTGYIGSRLYNFLKNDGYEVDTCDLEWYGNHVNPKNDKCDFSCYNYSGCLRKWDVIMLLAGHSSVPMCLNNCQSTFQNNVVNFVKLFKHLSPSQRFIYASSSSVYGNIGSKEATEDWHEFQPTNHYDLSKKEIDLYTRLSDLDYYGLRFGTVNGASPNLRVDIMINKMYDTAKKEQQIELNNPKISRPILAIKDLCRGVKAIIEGPKAPGVYNMASFNTTVLNIVSEVSSKLEVPVLRKEDTPSYNFSINCDKFKKTFNFEFKETVRSIVDELHEQWDHCVASTRAEKKIYV